MFAYALDLLSARPGRLFMKLRTYRRSFLVVLGLLAAVTLSTRTALQAQKGPKVKPVAQPDAAEAPKHGDQDDTSARIKSWKRRSVASKRRWAPCRPRHCRWREWRRRSGLWGSFVVPALSPMFQ